MPNNNTQYKLRYLVMPDFVYEDDRLSLIQVKVFCFINTYKGEKFYFTNEQMAEMFDCSVWSISKAVTALEEYGYIKADYQIKAKGGKIRFIQNLKNPKSDISYTQSPTLGRPKGNDNKVKDNKVNINNITAVYEHFIKEFKKNPKQYRLLEGRKKRIATRLNTWSVDDIKKAITNASKDSFYTGKNDRGWTADLDYICRNDEIMERLINLVPRTFFNKVTGRIKDVDLSKYDQYESK